MSQNKIISNLKWVVVTILLGAFGSGLWDLFLSDFINRVGVLSLELTSYMVSGFKDELYDGVSSGAIISLFRLPSFLAALLFVMIPTILLVRIIGRALVSKEGKDEHRSEKDIEEESKQLGNRLRVSLVSILIIVYFFEAFQYLYAAKAAGFVERSLDILAPHISQDERLRLKADFRSIESSEDYFKVYSELRNLEAQYSVDLPKFDPI